MGAIGAPFVAPDNVERGEQRMEGGTELCLGEDRQAWVGQQRGRGGLGVEKKR